MRQITAALADHNRVRRCECERLLRAECDIDVVAEASTISGAIEAVERLQPDVLVSSLSLAAHARFALLDALGGSRTRVVVLSGPAVKQSRLIHALAHGCAGFVAVSMLKSELPRAVRTITRGEGWVRRRLLSAFVDRCGG